MSYKLVSKTDPVLRQIAKPVTDLGSARIKRLAEDMDDIRIDEGGIGLAAPQIGVSERIIIIEVPDDDMVGVDASPGFPPTILVNPEIVWESETLVKLPEGCLSLPGLMGNVLRPERITVEAQDLDGASIVLHADRWLARVLQHEIDHLDGILYPDRIEDPSELWYVERVDINDPIFDNNPNVARIREKRMKKGSGEQALA